MNFASSYKLCLFKTGGKARTNKYQCAQESDMFALSHSQIEKVV